MLCIKHPNTDPWFNLAAEEYVLKHFSDDVFMLWRNHNAIIVGKHQNTLAEINIDYVKEKSIKVVRRMSGGGAVFHDLGNLNFTFIMNGEEGHLVDFRKFTQPILDVLRKLDIDAKFEGRNDLTIGGLKFSGNAEHVYKQRVLHHGTLLFSSLMSDLSNALKVNPLKYKDKAVKSVRSRVTNISEHLKHELDVLQFRDLVMEHIMEIYADCELYDYSPEDLRQINELVKEKYSTWEWNYGYSPSYDLEKMIRTNGGFIEFHLNVEHGIIKNIKIYGDFFSRHEISEMESLLRDTRHDEAIILKKLKPLPFDDYFHNVLPEEFVKGLF
ncbi:MAG: lipoate--protein ligase [Bacteroides sp.]|jgi:lipoate-protein ligase A|nr:lipoate--protein ligase [Bacteroides sp.]